MPYSSNVEANKPLARHTTPWKTPTLFWRTFLLIGLLLALSLYGWYQFFVWFERGPRAQQFAHQLVSGVNLTRAALLYADPAKRQQLLAELAEEEGIRIYPLKKQDVKAPLPNRKLFDLMEDFIQLELGTDTLVAGKVNNVDGLWISFAIDDDWFWAYFPKEHVTSVPTLEWLSWAVVALLLSLTGALILVQFVNRPIAQLTAAASLLASGRMPKKIPQQGPAEIRLLTASFNHMVQDLEQSEQDRTLMLAGISHDLRTPLTRLRLELEMSQLDEMTRHAISDDLDQMEMIVKQFMDYAQLQHIPARQENVNLSQLIEETLVRYQERTKDEASLLDLNCAIHPVPLIQGNASELSRLVINLLENARSYSQYENEQTIKIKIELLANQKEIILSLRDYGPGVPEDLLGELTRPFKRLDTARSNANGTGLGLAIVERIVQRHRGILEVSNVQTAQPNDHGLQFVIRFPFSLALESISPARFDVA